MVAPRRKLMPLTDMNWAVGQLNKENVQFLPLDVVVKERFSDMQALVQSSPVPFAHLDFQPKNLFLEKPISRKSRCVILHLNTITNYPRVFDFYFFFAGSDGVDWWKEGEVDGDKLVKHLGEGMLSGYQDRQQANHQHIFTNRCRSSHQRIFTHLGSSTHTGRTSQMEHFSSGEEVKELSGATLVRTSMREGTKAHQQREESLGGTKHHQQMGEPAQGTKHHRQLEGPPRGTKRHKGGKGTLE